jgi:hypothetical protein
MLARPLESLHQPFSVLDFFFFFFFCGTGVGLKTFTLSPSTSPFFGFFL